MKKAIAERFDAMTAEEKLSCIPSGGGPSEFEIQSFVYESLKSKGFLVRGEVMAKCGSCQFDLVVFDQLGKPTLIVEIKRGKHVGTDEYKRIARKRNASQIQKYEKYGVPVRMIVGMAEARRFVDSMCV